MRREPLLRDLDRGRRDPTTPSTSRRSPAARRERRCRPSATSGASTARVPRIQNTINGTNRARPSSRPMSRCVHSIRKIAWKWPSVMSGNRDSHIAGSACTSRTPPSRPPGQSGGITPVTGFHSVIDRPDSVSRVAPPTTTIRNTSAATLQSQCATAPPRPRTWAAAIWPREEDEEWDIRDPGWAREGEARRVDVRPRRQIKRGHCGSPDDRPDALCHPSVAPEPIMRRRPPQIHRRRRDARVRRRLRARRHGPGAGALRPNGAGPAAVALLRRHRMAWILPLMPLIRWMERPDDGPHEGWFDPS